MLLSLCISEHNTVILAGCILTCATASSVPLPALQDAAQQHLLLPLALLPVPRVLIGQIIYVIF